MHIIVCESRSVDAVRREYHVVRVDLSDYDPVVRRLRIQESFQIAQPEVELSENGAIIVGGSEMGLHYHRI